MHLLIEAYGKLFSIDFDALEALKTAINKAVGASPRPKVAEPSVVGIIQARSLGETLLIKAANQQISIISQDVPFLQEALNNVGAVLNSPITKETDKGDIGVMCYEPLEEVLNE
ncbi:MAG TPA: hypothetical protein PKL69_13540 [Agitococcus sp.]|nr:hypothetical protein [Agitococcus sp.]HMX99158.1 hypothetical protein [Agitococcus sp.]HNA21250.1 hypothetical protein [Agitococcus sp.]HNC02549.1 hypothetical protein [Agitococcus sp.]HNI62368.1 hypothetical protein [Agitococcus sp.]